MKLKLLFLLLVVFQVSYSQTAKIQFIHNAPDVSIAEVDVYVDDNLVIDNLAFKTGSTFLDIPFNGDMAQITITRSTDENEILVSRERMLVDQENYYVVIDGIFDTANYTDVEPLDIFLYEGARLEATVPDPVLDLDIIVHHGGLLGFDFELDIQGTQVLAAPLAVAYSIFYSEYSSIYMSDPNNGYSLWQSNEDIGFEILSVGDGDPYYYETFNFPLQSENLELENQAIIMLLTGFQHPENNNNGDPFDVFYLTPEGGAFRSATLDVDDVALQAISIYPNPAQDIITVKISSSQVKGTLYDMLGRVVLENIEVQAETIIDVSEFESGVYFLQLTDINNNASTMRRIIKK